MAKRTFASATFRARSFKSANWAGATAPPPPLAPPIRKVSALFASTASRSAFLRSHTVRGVLWSDPMPITTSFMEVPFYQREDVLLTLSRSPAGAVTGWSVRFTISDVFGPVVVSRDNGATGGVTVQDAANGVFTVLVPSSALNLAPADYLWEFGRTDAGAHAELANGTWRLAPSRVL